METKTKTKTLYHIFTNGDDDWTATLKEAQAIISDWHKDGATELRIYKQTYTDYGKDTEAITEDCIYSQGGFPS